jgi:mannose-6-phosphate isomerase
MRPVRLKPDPREKLWGKTRLMPWFPDVENPVGEVWFLCEQDLPLLVKLLFTSDRLSVQVHPDDGEDGPRGKTEMWHIVEAELGAAIALGFREPLTRERLRESCAGEIEGLLNWIPVQAGETYFAPAHTVHAIGPGIVLWEIQQNSDVTYRLWDYGRPRPLHIEQAVPISDLSVHPGAARSMPLSESHQELVRCKHFATELVQLQAASRHKPAPEECQLWICLEGCGSIGGETFRPGDVWLLPQEQGQPAICTAAPARFLRTYVPEASGRKHR